ncbi:MAG: hypothetical protein NC932_04185 [Candidatus Omnitrophica bacterium]|nr:hypothetical protein [Candidatus Omnitrophota bacterium]
MKIVIVGIGYVLCIWGGGFIIGKMCKILKLPHNQNIGLLKAVLINIYEPIGLLFVGKSIIRFSNREESEYFLIGTLASFSWAVFLGIILTFLIK